MVILLGLLSGVIFILAAPPFSLPFVSFFIFTPLVFLAARETPLPHKALFVAGFVGGALGVGFLSYHVFGNFAWPSDTLLRIFVQWSFLLWGLLLGCIWGGGLVLYNYVRFSSPLFNATLFASLYVPLEYAFQFITGHYYVGALAHSAAVLPGTFLLASLGGEYLVSFAVAFLSAFFGELLATKKRDRMSAQAFALFAVIAVTCAAHAYYLHASPAPTRNVSVAVIQTGHKEKIVFASQYEGEIFFPALAARLGDAAQGGTDLVVYPLAVVNEVLYVDTPPVEGYGDLRFLPRIALESWMSHNAPISSTAVTWDIVWSSDAYLQNYHFWNDGKLTHTYSKRRPYAFIERTPSVAHFGFGPTPAPISPGAGSGLTTLPSGTVVGNLQCSEVHLASLARQDAASAQFFLVIGLEWILPADTGEVYSLKAAQFRAAEQHMPVVRATVQGPSAIIDEYGNITEQLGFSEEGILRGTLSVPLERRLTLYALFGDYPLYAGVAGIFALALLNKRRVRFLETPE